MNLTFICQLSQSNIEMYFIYYMSLCMFTIRRKKLYMLQCKNITCILLYYYLFYYMFARLFRLVYRVMILFIIVKEFIRLTRLKDFNLDSIKHNHILPLGNWFVFTILYALYFAKIVVFGTLYIHICVDVTLNSKEQTTVQKHKAHVSVVHKTSPIQFPFYPRM